MKIDLSSFELHNVVRDARGELRTRRGFANHVVLAAGSSYVGAFSIEAPNTTEVWHALFIRNDTTGETILSMTTEEYVELFTYSVGVLPRDPIITMAIVNRQVVFNSPSFPQPIWGYVGGGLMAMTRVPSDNPSTTAIDIPVGHVASFGGRLAIAQGSIVYFNDATDDLDPRSFTAQNSFAVPGSIYDLFQGADGSLVITTSDGMWMMPVDAISQGQIVSFLQRVMPQVSTSASRNAAPTAAGTIVLQRDGVLLVNGGSQQLLSLPRYDGRRKLSTSVDVDDLRTFGSAFPTSSGAVVAFTKRPYFLQIDLRSSTYTWVHGGSAKSLVGVLTSRDGDTLHVFADRICAMVTTGPLDNDGTAIKGVMAGKIDVDIGDRPLIRRVNIGAANTGEAVGSSIAPNVDVNNTSPVLRGDLVIGSSAWDAAGATFQGRSIVTTRTTLNVRASEPHCEVLVGGGNRRVKATAELEAGGLARRRKDRQE